MRTTFKIWLFYARKKNLRIFGLKLNELKKCQNQEILNFPSLNHGAMLGVYAIGGLYI